jgi:hypothetical protein
MHFIKQYIPNDTYYDDLHLTDIPGFILTIGGLDLDPPCDRTESAVAIYTEKADLYGAKSYFVKAITDMIEDCIGNTSHPGLSIGNEYVDTLYGIGNTPNFFVGLGRMTELHVSCTLSRCFPLRDSFAKLFGLG